VTAKKILLLMARKHFIRLIDILNKHYISSGIRRTFFCGEDALSDKIFERRYA